MLQLPQEWSHFSGLQGAKEREGAALLHLRQIRPHGPWLRSRQRAEVLLLRRVWPHPETLRQGEMLQVGVPRCVVCLWTRRSAKVTEQLVSPPAGVARSAMLPCIAVKPARLTATTVESRATWQKSAPSKPLHNQHPLLPLLFFFRLMVGCIIFSESSSLAKVWLTEASPRPASLSSCNTMKGVKRYLSAFNTKSFSLVAVLCIMLCLRTPLSRPPLISKGKKWD